MLVNIQQPVIQSDGTLLLATDSKVQLQNCNFFFTWHVWQKLKRHIICINMYKELFVIFIAHNIFWCFAPVKFTFHLLSV